MFTEKILFIMLLIIAMFQLFGAFAGSWLSLFVCLFCLGVAALYWHTYHKHW